MSLHLQPRILLIDSYDSFTHNLVSLCRQAIPDSEVHIIKNDVVSIADLVTLLPYFSAVVVGPGPGSPKNPEDIGVVKYIWSVADEHLIPVFGVCLGLQSLAVEFGAKLRRLRVVKHGQISRILHGGLEIFKGVGTVAAVRYHSLHVELQGNEEVEPLAWADDGEENGRVVMAVKHRTRPFWAVQYHPESVCTRGGGDEVVRNFWRLAKNWAAITHRIVRPWDTSIEDIVGPAWPSLQFLSTSSIQCSRKSVVATRVLELPGLEVTEMCEILGVADECTDFVLLDSAAKPGRFSIIGCLDTSSPLISYWVGQPHVHVRKHLQITVEELGDQDIWSWLAKFMHARKAQGGVKDIPFWGGLAGFLSYELGVQCLSPLVRAEPRLHPDVNLAFVERSIIVDSVSAKVYVQSLRQDDDVWFDDVALRLKRGMRVPEDEVPSSPPKRRRKSTTTSPTVVTLPDRELYISRIKEAKDYLFSGDSYELCLTAPTRISVPKAAPATSRNTSSSWDLYKTVRDRNPAPHSAYLRLHPSTLVSSSPERFLSFSRPPRTHCQLRPIKGTVRKAPGVTRAIAEEALAGSAKEVAENLMIVDLIRHDLHGVVGADVDVKQFCQVEEYETVWQLVSVIEGKVSNEADLHSDINMGWEVLRRSLPPGSMTGAPKKRSVEILRRLESCERGIYSGVFGYWCVGGGGDWSVTIRSCFKYDSPHGPQDHPTPKADDTDSRVESTSDEWVLGAGGAITALSDPEAEWEEMIVKVESVMRAFGDVRFSEAVVGST
ncbi:Putative aminodeoxychorismate [Sparassis crispa]|uniref:aminodeoxychorismate synthase n=1 Tax=Sparassis crispa TaxID=139825 RepID=A0A401G6K1_9APHY|nr:Putative aminodeoxychorismate [Sparassis crispa]GBE77788.1 Putative aminodeoxychorismate [Sparassis crispa]